MIIPHFKRPNHFIPVKNELNPLKPEALMREDISQDGLSNLGNSRTFKNFGNDFREEVDDERRALKGGGRNGRMIGRRS